MSAPEGKPETVREILAQDSGFPRWELEDWAAHGLVAGVTAAGEETGLGLLEQLSPAAGNARWRRFLATWDSRFNRVAISRQVHGNTVGVVETGGEGLLMVPDRDGHATGARGLLLAVSVADCIPVFLADPSQRLVCLLHAGWRGTASRIVEAGVAVLKTLGARTVENLVMHCGVGVCGACYEVDSDVAFAVTGVEYSQKTTVDLRMALVAQARDLGVGRITASDHCTIHGGSGFYSHRRSGGSLDRMVAYLGVPDA